MRKDLTTFHVVMTCHKFPRTLMEISNKMRWQRTKIFALIVVSLILGSSANFAHATINFSSVINLSNTVDDSVFPKIAANNNNVYVTWQENLGTGEVYFNASSNRGVSFTSGSSVNLSNDATHDSEDIDFGVYQNNVYIVWQNNTAAVNEKKIEFIRSTNNGTTFESIINISGDQTLVDAPRLAVFGESVYVMWEQDATGDILVDARPTNGSASLGIENVSSDVTDSSQAEIIANSTNVFVVWKDEQGADEIRFARSTDGGDNFAASLNISNDAHDSLEPDMAIGNGNVYVVWRNNTAADNVAFASSTDSGAMFSAAKNIGSSTASGIRPDSIQIEASGSNVYVTWAEIGSNNDVFVVTSNDGGATFTTPKNLSDNSGLSSEPSLSVSGSNVYVAWKDSTPTGDNSADDILMKFSTNNGQNFCGSATNVSNDARDSEKAQLASTSDKVYLIWEDGPGGDQQVLFKVADIPTPDCVEWGKAQYTLNESATITVTDATQAGNINVTVKSDSDGTGITKNLSETGVGTGVFTGTITFTTGSSAGSAIKAKAGDTITATFGSSKGTASIHPITISFAPGSPTLNNIVTVTVTDLNSNATTSVETINIQVTSSVDSTGTSLTLTETGAKTGVFTHAGGLVLMTGNDLFTLDQEIKLELVESGTNIQNADTNAVDKITMNFASSTDATGINVILTETGVNTGVFQNVTTFSSSGPSGTTSLHSSQGDIISVTFLGEISRGLIIPNSDASRGAIQASTGGSVTATYNGKSNSFTVAIGTGGGGGGGGLVRPTVVLNAIAGAQAVFGGGGGSDRTPPITTLNDIIKSKSINVPEHIQKIMENQKLDVPIKPLIDEPYDLPLEINEKKYPLGDIENRIETDKLQVGAPVKFKMLFYEQSELEHVSLYMNLRDNLRSDQSDTFIIYEKRAPMNIVDRNGFFESVNFEIVEGEDNKKFAIFEITFAKPMETSDLVYKTWDFDRRGTAIKVHDAIQVGEMPTPEEPQTQTENIQDKKPVPDWVKSNAKWWSEGQIDDKTFTNGIGFLISEKIINVPVGPNVSVSKDDDQEIAVEEEPKEFRVPQWIKTNAKWWVEDLIDEETFLAGIEYLVKHEIIAVI